MRFGKTERQKQLERQAMEWAHVLGIKKFLWFPERLSSGEVAWLETVVQQWRVVMVDARGGEIEVEGYPLCTYTLKEWDEQGSDYHQLFEGSCPPEVKDLLSKYNIAKIPYPGRDNPRVLNNLLDDLSMDDMLKDLTNYNIAKIPSPGRDKSGILNNFLDDLSMDDMKDLNHYNENKENGQENG